MTGQREEPVIVDRAQGNAGGELVLRRMGDAYEIISNGVFLMDTRNGESERLLVGAALDHLAGRMQGAVRMLLGGLGVGFSLAAALRNGDLAVTVVELERAVIDWHATHLRPYSRGALDDPRVRIENADVLSFLRTTPERYEAICLDVDNGPDWMVTEANAALYGAGGLDLLAERLAPGGVLAVWSAHPCPTFDRRLRARFKEVDVHAVPVPRGEPDVVYVARGA